MKNPVYVFDVDGVLSDIGMPISHDVVRELARLLSSGHYVAINTGRAYDMVGVKVVELLKSELRQVNDMSRLYVVTEMGGVVCDYEDGEPRCVRTRFKLSKKDITRAVRIIENKAYESMYSYTKVSMATARKNDNATQEAFLVQRDALIADLNRAFPKGAYTVQATVESVDVHAAQAGKQAGAELIYGWLQQISDVNNAEFICFGDSKGDYEMARWYAQQGLQTRFVYTGNNLELSDPHDGVEVIDTTGLYTAGTLAYLREIATEKRQPIFDLLAELQIDYRLQEHRAVYTVAESSGVLPEKVPVKTLLVTDDKKSQVWMVAMRGDFRLDMKELAKLLLAKKLQFVRAERVEEIVGVPPGSVSIFGLLHPGSKNVQVIVDQALMSEKEIGFHPQDNTATVFLRPEDLPAIIAATGHLYRAMMLSA